MNDSDTAYIEVLRRDGQPTGQIVSEEEIHRVGHWHRTVHVWVVNDKGDILLQQRSPKRDHYPNMWNASVTGHVRAGDSSLQTVFQAMDNELGLEKNEVLIDHQRLFFIDTFIKEVTLNNNTYKDNELVDLYILKQNLLIRNMSIQIEEIQALDYISEQALELRIDSNDETLICDHGEFKLLFDHLKQAA